VYFPGITGMSNGSTTTGSTHCSTVDGDAETLDLQARDPATGRAPDSRHLDLATVMEGHEEKTSTKTGHARASSALKGVKRLGKPCYPMLAAFICKSISPEPCVEGFSGDSIDMHPDKWWGTLILGSYPDFAACHTLTMIYHTCGTPT
jgi:hypothetical protein